MLWLKKTIFGEAIIILVSDVLSVAESLGFQGVTPVVLGDAGNLVIHLSPYNVVARIAKLFADDDSNLWKAIWAAEIKVSQHLMERGIPVVPCSSAVPPNEPAILDNMSRFSPDGA